jgi:hypothetical protein
MRWGRLGGGAVAAALLLGTAVTAAGADAPSAPQTPPWATRSAAQAAQGLAATAAQGHILQPPASSPRAGTGGVSASAITDGLCVHQVFSDANEPGDTQLDATSYELGFDCVSSRFVFGVTTADSWDATNLDFDAVAFDVNLNLNDGCGGVDYIAEIVGLGDGTVAAVLLRTPDCNTDNWRATGTPNFAVDHSVGNQVAFSFSAPVFRNSKTLRWQGAIKSLAEGDGGVDFLPDGDIAAGHFRSFPGNPCGGRCFYLTNGTTGGAADIAFRDTQPGNQILFGDWDGNGGDSLGFRNGATFALKNALAPTPPATTFTYGKASDTVLVGDWDGNGTSTLAVRRGNTYFLKNTLGGGPADITVAYGKASDTVLVGDWDGNGTDTLAVRRGSMYFIKNSFSAGPADIVVAYGRAGDAVLVGDWNGDGSSTLTVRRGNAYFLKNSFTGGPADITFNFGTATDVTFAGDWNADGTDSLGVCR